MHYKRVIKQEDFTLPIPSPGKLASDELPLHDRIIVAGIGEGRDIGGGDHVCKERQSSVIPSLGQRLLPPLGQLPLSWLGALHEGALLTVELAENAAGLAFVDHASALPPPAGITRAIPPRSRIGSGLDGCGAARAGGQDMTSEGVPPVGVDVDGGGLRVLARSYGNGSCTSDAGWVRHLYYNLPSQGGSGSIGGGAGPRARGLLAAASRVSQRLAGAGWGEGPGGRKGS